MGRKTQSIKFAVGAPDGSRSSIWQLWVADRKRNAEAKSDIYLHCYATKGWMKISLHESGSWQQGYTNEAVKKDSTLGVAFNGRRHMAIWPRPKPFRPGITLGYQILIPGDELSDYQLTTLPSDIVWHPKPPPGCGIEYSVMILAPEKTHLLVRSKYQNRTQLLFDVLLANGERVMLFSNIVRVTDALWEKLRDSNRQMLKNLGTGFAASAEMPRATIFFDKSDGGRGIVDTVWPIRSWILEA